MNNSNIILTACCLIWMVFAGVLLYRKNKFVERTERNLRELEDINDELQKIIDRYIAHSKEAADSYELLIKAQKELLEAKDMEISSLEILVQSTEAKYSSVEVLLAAKEGLIGALQQQIRFSNL